MQIADNKHSNGGYNVNSLVEKIIEEMKSRGIPTETIQKAQEILENPESRKRILDKVQIDKDKIEKATEIKNKIQALANSVVALRYSVNEASKILGKRLFEDNTETARIANQLVAKVVIDQESLHIFIDDLHKYIIQAAYWNTLNERDNINSVLRIIEIYRNSFDHIYDMKGKGTGSEAAYKELGLINNELLGHKIIQIEEYPLLQIGILERVQVMLSILERNIESWLK